MKFPTTLRLIATRVPATHRVHVYAEHRGCRYYAGSFTSFAEAEASIKRLQVDLPEAAFYLRDRADSTAIDGGFDALMRSC